MYGRTELGSAEIEPHVPVVAGTTGTWRLTYCVGSLGIDDGGTIKVAMRFASDWGAPQNTDPSCPNYFTVSTTGISKLKARFDRKGYYRPWHKAIVVDVLDDALAPGDIVTITFERAEAQTFCERTFEFKVAVDCFGTQVFQDLPEQPEIEIVSGPATKLVLISPTQVVTGEPFWLGVKLEDHWGNPSRGFDGTVSLHGEGVEGLSESIRFTAEDRGVKRIEGLTCMPHPPGRERPPSRSAPVETDDHGTGQRPFPTLRITGKCGDLEATSPPLQVLESPPEYRAFWGDLHGQSEETIGTNTAEDYFTFARDSALLDFAGHQGNDFQITPEFWRRLTELTAEFNAPGRFVTMPGYEWSAVHPLGGDRNVYFLHDDSEIFRSSRWQAPASPADTECNDAGRLFDKLKGMDAFVVAHVGGRPANLEFHCDEVEPLIEVASAWGQFEWMIEDAMRLGHTIGFCAGSDDHKGRPGASYPGRSFFGQYGGLTCVYAADPPCRERPPARSAVEGLHARNGTAAVPYRLAIFEALRARRCYATNGRRIILRVSADGHIMGSEYSSDGPRRIEIEAVGTSPIERIDLFRNMEIIASWPESVRRSSDRLRVAWGGAKIRGRGRIAEWDGHLELTSGRITAVEPYALDSPSEVVQLESDRRVTFRTCTAGDEDGMILTLDGADDAEMSFVSPLIEARVRVSDAVRSPVRIDGGGIDLHVTFEALPLPDESSLVVEHIDASPLESRAAYWVRVTQSDGGKAWSSPVYVSARP